MEKVYQIRKRLSIKPNFTLTLSIFFNSLPVIENLIKLFIFLQIEMKFNEKFYGIAYADFDRNSACQVRGKGALSYKLELPLKGCGTKQVG